MADSFYQSTSMPLGIIDAIDNSILVRAGWQDICTRFHRVHPQTLVNCQESDNFIKDHLKNKEVCQYKCKNGLWDIGMSITISGKHLATMFLGQFFYEDENLERKFFVGHGEKFGFDIDLYLKALDQVPHFTHEKIEYILSYSQSFVGFITKIAESALANKNSDVQLREQNQIMQGILQHTHIMLPFLIANLTISGRIALMPIPAKDVLLFRGKIILNSIPIRRTMCFSNGCRYRRTLFY